MIFRGKRISLVINSHEHCFILYFALVFCRIVIKLKKCVRQKLFDISVFEINQLQFPLTMFFFSSNLTKLTIFTGDGCIQSIIKCSQYNWKVYLLIQIDRICIKLQKDIGKKIGTCISSRAILVIISSDHNFSWFFGGGGGRISFEINSHEHFLILYFSTISCRIEINFGNYAHQRLFDMPVYEVNQLHWISYDQFFFLTIWHNWPFSHEFQSIIKCSQYYWKLIC